MYHRIADETFDPWGLAVPEDRFREQLDWLRAHRLPLSLGEFASLHRSGKLPRNAVAVTFDDGYACNSTRAAPCLGEYGIPATMFVTTNPVTAIREFWWDELERLLLGIEASELVIELPAGPLDIHLGSKQEDDRDWAPFADARTPRQVAYHRVWQSLRQRDPDQQQSILEDLRTRAGFSAQPRETHRPMTRSEVNGLKDHGIVVGAHSLTHTSLPERTKLEKKREIEGSRDECAALVGAPPRTFAYPYGDFDEESASLVKAAGFDCACTTVETAVGRSADAFKLPRLQVRNWSSGELADALAKI
jgi:peptidoglycan/xylan/chitin deacetylase (PgdA/CDA1 family)